MVYISRDEAIKELYEVYENEYPTASGDFDEYASHDVPNVLRNMKAADVQSVKRGEWEDEYFDEGFNCFCAVCSVCGYESTDHFSIIDNHKYCEYCGARMIKNSDAE